MVNSDKLIAIVAVAIAMLSLAYALSGPDVPQWLQPVAAHERMLFYVLGGFMAGVGVTVFAYTQAERNAPTSWIYIVLFCSAVMATAAVQTDQLSFSQALLVVLLGSVALVAAGSAISRFQKGDRVELESHWGGLGGGLGGWRVSAVTMLSLLALMFAGSAVVAVRAAKGIAAPPLPTAGSAQQVGPSTIR